MREIKELKRVKRILEIATRFSPFERSWVDRRDDGVL